MYRIEEIVTVTGGYIQWPGLYMTIEAAKQAIDATSNHGECRVREIRW